MGKTVDDRVVAMSFENAKFEANAKQTISTLDRLKQSLNLGGASKGLQDVASSSDKLKQSLNMKDAARGLQDISTASKNVQLGHIAQGVDAIRQKFSALTVAATAALSTIVAKATLAGIEITKSLTIAPVTGGLREYETQLNAVQTILANTQASGAKLKDVNKALDELNRYSDLTIYNFSEMARNIGTFTAAGVDLKTSTQAIKGIANLAALSGSNSQQASTAMYQLSQAISAGRVSLQDWNSVVNAGMGGTVFQRALAQTAVKMGKLDEGAVKLTGKMKNVSIAGESFRQSIQGQPGKDSWLTSDVLTRTLSQFTGDLTKAELKAQGFNDAQIKAIQAQAKTAQEAATKVKTLTQLLSTARETAESGWGQTWRMIFGNFSEARNTFTEASNALNGLINSSAEARNAVLKDWKDLGGRTALIQSIKNVLQAIVSVIKPIRDAFREIFPAKTGRQLYEMTVRLREFTEQLKIGPETADKLKRSFAGLFAIFSIAKSILSGVFTVIKRVFGVLGEGSGGFLDITARIGDFLVSLDEAIKKSTGFKEVFERLGDALAKPIALLGQLGSALAGLFSGDNGGSAALESTLNGIGSVLEKVIGLFKELGKAILEALSGADYSDVMDTLQVGLLGGLVVLVRNFFKNFSLDLTGGLLDSIVGSFNQLTGTLKAMQRGIQADTIMKIAVAVGILTISVVALSKIDGAALSKALSGLGVAFAQLLVAMGIIAKLSATGGFVKIPVLASSMILLSVAINILVLAVKQLSTLSWEELGKGLAGVTALLVGLSAAAVPLAANSAGMISAGVGILAISVAMKALASAIEDFGSMDWSTIGKGIGSIAAALVAIGVAMRLVPPSIAVTGVGLIAVAVGLRLLGAAISAYGKLDIENTAKALGIMVAAIVALGLATSALPATLALQAAGLVVLSVALAGIAGAIGAMGSMSVETLAKGLVALGASLLILAGGLALMSGSIGGAAALILAATALTLLVPPLLLLGQQSWGSIVKGLVGLAGAFVVLGVAGALIGPMAPALLALGAALAVLGVAMLAFGAGVALLGTGLAAIAVSGPAAVGILVHSFLELARTMPKVAVAIATGLITIVSALAKQAPVFAIAMGKLIAALATAVIIAAPKIAQAFVTVVLSALSAIRAVAPAFITTGMALFVALLQGIANNIGRIVGLVGTIVTNFLNALAGKLPEIMQAGARVLLRFLEGISQNIGNITRKVAEIVTKFINALANKATNLAKAGGKLLANTLKGIADKLDDVVEAAGDVVASFIEGLGDAASKLITAGTNLIIKVIRGIGRASARIAEAAAQTIEDFLDALKETIDSHAAEITQKGIEIGIALCKGVASGILGAGRSLIEDALNQAKSFIPGGMKKALGINSPARVMIPIGYAISEGLALGITKSTPIATAAASKSAYSLLNTYQKNLYKESFKPIGEYLATTFKQGLLGPAFTPRNELDQLIDDVKVKMTEAIATAKDAKKQAIDERASIRNQTKKSETDKKNYEKLGKAIKAYNLVIKDASKLRASYMADLTVERAELKSLTAEYNDYTTRLQDAESALNSLRSAKEQSEKSITDKYSALPEIGFTSDPTNPWSIQDYISGLQSQVNAVETYRRTLEQLRAMGLDDATYNKLLEAGTAGQEFANSLISGGPQMIATLNQLDLQLQTSAKTLGVNASASLFDAGIAAAEGLVKGLQSKQSAIAKEMEKIATKMITAIKKKLHIKSPSREMEEVGRFAAEGMGVGLRKATTSVISSAENMGDQALASLKSSLTDMAKLVTSEIDSNPVITPVLDLTQIQTDAKQLAELSKYIPLDTSTSYAQAAAINAAQKEAQKRYEESVASQIIQFEQNNYSPEALSTAEIYRQTNNQISKAKALLG